MATTIFFNGRVIATPGAYSLTDASALNTVGLGANGIVAVLGQAEGGIPVSAFAQTSDIPRFNTASDAAKSYRSGDLLEAANMAFAPSSDPAISGGAQQLLSLKVNPATQAALTLSSPNGPAVVFTSKDWGAFASQINVTVATGSSQGKLLTIQFEDTIESVDNLGGSPVATLQYNTTATSWQTMVAGVASDGSVHANATRSVTGLTGSIASITGTPALSVTATSADAGKTITLHGLNATGVVVREVVQLVSGTATTVNQYSALYGIYAPTAVAGTVTVANGASTLATLSVGAAQVGLALFTYGYVASAPVTFTAVAGNTSKIIIEGLNTYGSIINEVVTLNGTTPVSTTNNYTQIKSLSLANAPATAITVSAVAAQSAGAVQSTIQKQADFFNAKSAVVGGSTYGFVYTIQPSVSTNAALPATELDPTSADVSVLNAAQSFYANLYALINWVNTNSQLVSATEAANAIGAPSNTGGAVFLSGGGEGTTTFTQWMNALNWLKKVRVNTVVALTSDPAVTAAVDSHCAYMNGVGRSERDGLAGIMNPGLTDVATKSQILTQIQALNTRNLRACPQAVSRYDTTGTLTEFPPHFTALLGAAMQAGSPVGTSLTFKYVSAVGFRQDSSWNPVDDSDTMITGGTFFLQQIDGKGIRWVRNVTTYLQDNNIAYVEAGVNEAVNYASYNFRTLMEVAVGQPGFAGTINAARSVAIGILADLISSGAIVGWKNLEITLVGDVMQVSVAMAPVIAINFVPITIHLYTVSQSTTATPTAAAA